MLWNCIICIYITNFDIKNDACNYLVLTTNGQFIGNLRFWRFILYLSAAIDFCGNVPRKTWKQIFCKNTQVLRTRQYFRSNAIFVLHSWHIFRQTCHLPANEERRVNRALWTPHPLSPGTSLGRLPSISRLLVALPRPGYPWRERAAHWSATTVRLSAIKSGLFARSRAQLFFAR